MTITSASCEHSTIGFPGVVLKFHVENNKPDHEAIVVINGIIARQWTWQYHAEAVKCLELNGEFERFDNWVRSNYSEDVSVQG